jgi:hypothetical protein
MYYGNSSGGSLSDEKSVFYYHDIGELPKENLTEDWKVESIAYLPTCFSWDYKTKIKDKFTFRARNYGNYTINVSTECEQNISTIFVNISRLPSITSVTPTKFRQGQIINMYVGTYSDVIHFVNASLKGKISNNYPLTWSDWIRWDYDTSEPYNSSSTAWILSIPSLDPGIYSLTFYLYDSLGNKANRTENITIEAAYCGDGYCDFGDTCTSCPEDCGSCPGEGGEVVGGGLVEETIFFPTILGGSSETGSLNKSDILIIQSITFESGITVINV